MSAYTIRQLRTRFVAADQHPRAEIARIRSDPFVTADGKTQQIATLETQRANRHADAMKAAREALADVRKEYDATRPATIHRRAALKDPQRAAAMRDLAAGAPVSELRAMIDELVRARDAAGAHGMRLALDAALPTMDGREAGELRATLDTIRTEDAATARAALIAAQTEVQLLAFAGQNGGSVDALFASPADTLNAVREAATLPDGTYLTPEEHAALCEQAGCPLDAATADTSDAPLTAA